jgi:hypothetical protein
MGKQTTLHRFAPVVLRDGLGARRAGTHAITLWWPIPRDWGLLLLLSLKKA